MRLDGMSFEGFATARLPSLLRYAVVLTGDRDLAQDVVQEVMARAQLRWAKIEAATSPEAYLRRMIVNEYLSWRRSWAVRNLHPAGDRLTDLSDLASGHAGSHRGDPAQRVVDADAVWALLATLPRRQRAAVVLRYYEGLDDRSIAATLGCTAVTVRAHISKALKTLRLDHAPALDPRPTPSAATT